MTASTAVSVAIADIESSVRTESGAIGRPTQLCEHSTPSVHDARDVMVLEFDKMKDAGAVYARTFGEGESSGNDLFAGFMRALPRCG